MGLHTIAPDVLLTCPLDDSHRILKSRMQFHLVRCLKNHTLEKKMKCPWNPLHIVDRFAYLDHCNNKCEDLSNAMGSIIRPENEAQRDVASIPVNAANVALPLGEEDWDAGSRQVATYDPLKNSEGKPLLRSCVGLSKAKRKEFREQERTRHRQLNDILPITTHPTTQKPAENLEVTSLSCRAPHNLQIALSGDASVMEEINSSKVSDNDVNWPKNLKNPRAPIPESSYVTLQDPAIRGRDGDQSVTLFDSQFEFDDIQGYGSTSKNLRVERRDGNWRSRDTTIEAIRKLIEQPNVFPKKSFAAVASSAKKEFQSEQREIHLQDEAANFPAILPSRVELTRPAEYDVVDQLTKRLANLTNLQKNLDDEKAAILQQMSQLETKLNKPETPIVNRISKCAANFGQTKEPENLPTAGTGRGFVVDFGAGENSRPGQNRVKQQDNLTIQQRDDTKENTNPFLSVVINN